VARAVVHGGRARGVAVAAAVAEVLRWSSGLGLGRRWIRLGRSVRAVGEGKCFTIYSLLLRVIGTRTSES
jgi:hypothetical protein